MYDQTLTEDLLLITRQNITTELLSAIRLGQLDAHESRKFCFLAKSFSNLEERMFQNDFNYSKQFISKHSLIKQNIKHFEAPTPLRNF
jgi:hypothetical protein